jgi:hypothetical protein
MKRINVREGALKKQLASLSLKWPQHLRAALSAAYHNCQHKAKPSHDSVEITKRNFQGGLAIIIDHWSHIWCRLKPKSSWASVPFLTPGSTSLFQIIYQSATMQEWKVPFYHNSNLTSLHLSLRGQIPVVTRETRNLLYYWPPVTWENKKYRG